MVDVDTAYRKRQQQAALAAVRAVFMLDTPLRDRFQMAFLLGTQPSAYDVKMFLSYNEIIIARNALGTQIVGEAVYLYFGGVL